MTDAGTSCPNGKIGLHGLKPRRGSHRPGRDTEGVIFDAGADYFRRRRMSDLHLKPNGKFEVRWRAKGKRYSKTFDVRTDAEKFDAKIRRRKQLGGAAMHLHHLTRSETGDQVYVVRGGDAVKIGISADPVLRVALLQTGCPVPLVLVWRISCPDAKRLETALHQRYRTHRLHGEWFRAQPVLTDLQGLANLGALRFEPSPQTGGGSVAVSLPPGDAGR